MKNVYKWFRKDCDNELRSYEFRDGNIVYKMYRHPDLNELSKQAFENGEEYFYPKPANPNRPNGKQVSGEPEYVYRLRHPLTQEELNELFGEEVYVDPSEFFKERYNGEYINLS